MSNLSFISSVSESYSRPGPGCRVGERGRSPTGTHEYPSRRSTPPLNWESESRRSRRPGPRVKPLGHSGRVRKGHLSYLKDVEVTEVT